MNIFGSGFSIPVRLCRHYSLIPPIYTSPIAIFTENTKYFYNPHVKKIRSSITGSLTKSTDRSKPPLNSLTSTDIDAETSLSPSSATSCQKSTSVANP
ncbi:hypothetical protein AYI68_g1142 [Smittium mucronatum]|uniref:Uncharacterized protein n=1 Tax=Smittium mucronatum TaxID=133383 RepID=A0A1R0H6H6_9FUNG|nr:hypothetical protein AYI68_g1142 [Smittium mucronatum]